MEENTKGEELQKFLLFFNSMGILTYSFKQKSCYQIGLLLIIISSLLNSYLEASKESKISFATITSGRLAFKYIATFTYLCVVSFIYYLYNKYESYIYTNDKKGDFAKYSKQITYIFITILIMELVFILNKNGGGNDTVMLFSFVLYLLTLRLTVISANIYTKVRYI